MKHNGAYTHEASVSFNPTIGGVGELLHSWRGLTYNYDLKEMVLSLERAAETLPALHIRLYSYDALISVYSLMVSHGTTPMVPISAKT